MLGSNLEADLRLCTSDTEWDSLVTNSPESTPFLKSAFLRSIGEENSRFLLYVNDEVVLGTCLYKPTKNDNILRHSFTLYQGIFFPLSKRISYADDNERLKYFRCLISILDENKSAQHLSFHPGVNDLRAIDWYYFNNNEANLKPKITIRYTGIISLDKYESFEHYLRQIRQSRFRDYKRSLESSYTYQEESHEIDDFIELYKMTFDRQGIEVNSQTVERISRIIQSGLSHRSGRLSFLRNNAAKAVSGMFILSDDETDFYLFGASDPKYRDSNGPTRMLLEAIENSFENSRQTFDVCGMNSPTRGEFKSSFDARVKPYYEVDLELLRK